MVKVYFDWLSHILKLQIIIEACTRHSIANMWLAFVPSQVAGVQGW
jgi:hypothetical protein